MKSTIVLSLLSAIILIAVGYGVKMLFASGTGTCTINGEVRPMEDCGQVAGIISYLLIIAGILAPIMAYLHYRVTVYVITNKRLLLKSGLIGADMITIYYDQIKTSFVKVGIIGKIFGTGSILVDTGKITQGGGRHNRTRVEYDKFANIKNPYEVYKHVQEKTSSRKENLYAGKAAG